MTLLVIHRRVLIPSLIALITCFLFTSCMTEPPATTQPTSPSTTSLPPTSTPTSIVQNTPTVTPTAIPRPATAVTATLELGPLQPPRDQTILDRTTGRVEALTDGQKKYKIALWSPGAEWIAVVPQDGPGLDVVSAQTGALHSLVTDTYILEPAWLDATTLLIHQVADNTDVLVQYTLNGPQFASRVVVESTQPLLAVGAAHGRVSYVQGSELTIQQASSPAESLNVRLMALLSVPAPDADPAFTVAVSPWVADLQQVQALLVEQREHHLVATFLSAPGEGLWLPHWAPDAAKLALTQIGGRVVTTTRDGRSRYDLGPGDRPAWAPDSSRIAFAGTSAGKEYISRDIHIVDWQGTQPRLRLTNANDEQFYTSPSWSPDGSRIAFVEIDSGQIFVRAVPQQ